MKISLRNSRTALPFLAPVLWLLFLYIHAFTLPSETAERVLVQFLPAMVSFHLLLLLLCGAALLVRRLRQNRLHFDAGIVLLLILSFFAVLFLPPHTHRLYFDEDISIQIAESISAEHRAGMVDLALPDRNARGWRGLEYSLNKEPIAFPVLVSFLERFLPGRHSNGAAVSVLLHLAGILGLYCLGRRLGEVTFPGKNKKETLWAGRATGFTAASLYAFWPENLRWAVTASVEPTAAGLAILAVAVMEAAGREKDRLTTMTAFMLGTFAVQVRPEGLLLLPVLGFSWLAGFRGFSSSRSAGDNDSLPDSRTAQAASLIRGRSLPLLVVLTAALLLPHLLLLKTTGHQDWGATGPKFSLQFLRGNLETNLRYWFFPRKGASPPAAPPFPAWFALFSLLLLPLFSRLFREKTPVVPSHETNLRAKNDPNSSRSDLSGKAFPSPFFLLHAAVISWFLLFFGVFLFFYAGSYHYGADVRFALLAAPPIFLEAACGVTGAVLLLYRTTGGVPPFNPRLLAFFFPVLFVAGGFLTETARLGEEAWQARCDHSVVRTWAETLPDSAVIVTHTPALWLVHHRAALQVVWAVNRIPEVQNLVEKYPVFYHAGYWDASPSRSPTPWGEISKHFLKNFDSTPVRTTFAPRGWTFRLFRITNRVPSRLPVKTSEEKKDVN